MPLSSASHRPHLGWTARLEAVTGGAVEYEWVVTNITNTPSVSEEAPAIRGNMIVWDNWGYGDDDIFLYDILTKTTFNLTESPTVTDWGAEVCDTHVAWNAQGGSAGSDIEVKLFRFADGKWFSASNTYDDEWPSLSGHWAMWNYFPGGSQGAAQIAAQDLLDDSIYTWENNYDKYFPRTDGYRGVWSGWDGQDYDVFVVDLTKVDPSARHLTNTAGDERDPDIDGDHVVWVSSPRTDGSYLGEIVFYDMATEQLLALTNDNVDDRTPRVAGDLVTWTRDVAGTSGGLQVMLWDRQTGKTTVLSEGLADAEGPNVDGHSVVFAGRSSRAGETDIYLAQYLPVGDLPPDTVSDFPDVPVGHAYEEAIMDLSWLGIIGGYTNGDFGLNDSVKRMQFAKMIVGALGITPGSSTATRFTDLGSPDASGYPHKYVQAAYETGITHGTNATQTVFAPSDPIRRDQVVSMIVRGAVAQFPGTLRDPTQGIPSVFDGVGEPHGENLRIAEYNGLLDGLIGMGPAWSVTANATRGEVAQMLWNLLGLVPGD